MRTQFQAGRVCQSLLDREPRLDHVLLHYVGGELVEEFHVAGLVVHFDDALNPRRPERKNTTFATHVIVSIAERKGLLSSVIYVMRK
jgi:hypothetical protein